MKANEEGASGKGPITRQEIDGVLESIHHNGASELYNEFEAIWRIDKRILNQWDATPPQNKYLHFEALARVKGRPGCFPPSVLEAIERNGLTNKFYEKLLRTALGQAQRHALRPTINILPQVLPQRDLASVIEHAIDINNADPATVGIEINERCPPKDVRRALKNLVHLHNLGVKILLDDADHDKEKRRLRAILDILNPEIGLVHAAKIDMHPVMDLDAPDATTHAFAEGTIRHVMNTAAERCTMVVCEGLNPPTCAAEQAKQRHLLRMCPKELTLAGQGGASVDGAAAGKILKGENILAPHRVHLKNCNEHA